MLKEIDLLEETELTPGQERFLIAYSQEWDVAEACANIKDFSMNMHYESLKTNETYRKWWDAVQQMIQNKAEDEALRRAIKGVQKPKFNRQGEITRVETEYSDTLLKSFLAAKVEGYNTTYKPKTKDETREVSEIKILNIPDNNRGKALDDLKDASIDAKDGKDGT